MDNPVLIRLEQATEALAGLLESPEAYEQMDMVEKLLEVRDVCLKRFDSDIRPMMERPDVRQRLQQILSRDRQIAEGMQRLQDSAKTNLIKIRQNRHAQAKYEGYGTKEAFFLDKEY